MERIANILMYAGFGAYKKSNPSTEISKKEFNIRYRSSLLKTHSYSEFVNDYDKYEGVVDNMSAENYKKLYIKAYKERTMLNYNKLKSDIEWIQAIYPKYAKYFTDYKKNSENSILTYDEFERSSIDDITHRYNDYVEKSLKNGNKPISIENFILGNANSLTEEKIAAIKDNNPFELGGSSKESKKNALRSHVPTASPTDLTAYAEYEPKKVEKKFLNFKSYDMYYAYCAFMGVDHAEVMAKGEFKAKSKQVEKQRIKGMIADHKYLKKCHKTYRRSKGEMKTQKKNITGPSKVGKAAISVLSKGSDFFEKIKDGAVNIKDNAADLITETIDKFKVKELREVDREVEESFHEDEDSSSWMWEEDSRKIRKDARKTKKDARKTERIAHKADKIASKIEEIELKTRKRASSESSSEEADKTIEEVDFTADKSADKVSETVDKVDPAAEVSETVDKVDPVVEVNPVEFNPSNFEHDTDFTSGR